MWLSVIAMLVTVGWIGINAGGRDTHSYDKTTIGVVLGLSGAASIMFILGLFLFVSRFPASAMNIMAIVCSFNIFLSLAAVGISTLVKV